MLPKNSILMHKTFFLSGNDKRKKFPVHGSCHGQKARRNEGKIIPLSHRNGGREVYETLNFEAMLNDRSLAQVIKAFDDRCDPPPPRKRDHREI